MTTEPPEPAVCAYFPRLRINYLPVDLCTCSGAPHWSVDDLVKAVGRPLTNADMIRVDIIAEPTGYPVCILDLSGAIK